MDTEKIGWREWVVLPGLEIPGIKAKVDTGARTSSLHAFKIDTAQKGGVEYVKFLIHPLQRREDVVISCEAPVLDRRVVRDSGGHEEERYVIETPVRVGKREWPIEITLTSRDDMRFRMLLGRTALKSGGLEIQPARSYLLGKKPKGAYPKRKRQKKT